MATKSKPEDQPSAASAPYDWEKANREYKTPLIGGPQLMDGFEARVDIARNERLKNLARRNRDVAYLMGK